MDSYANRSTIDLEPGDHICTIYETESERDSCLREYFLCGLHKNEKILYIAGLHDADAISKCLLDKGLDIECCSINGQMKTVDISNILSQEISSNSHMILNLIRSEAKRAMVEGYSALRVAVEMISSLKSGDIAEYEAEIGDFTQGMGFSGIGCLALCLYSQSRFDPGTIMDVLRCHPLVMVGSEVCRNLYYIPPKDLQTHGLDRATLIHAKENLLEHKHAEIHACEFERKFQEISERSIDVMLRDGMIEELQKQSERKFRSIIEESIDGIVLIDETGAIIEWNQGAQANFGLKRSDVLGRLIWDVQFQLLSEEKRTPEFLRFLKYSMQNLLKTGESPYIKRLSEVVSVQPSGRRSVIQNMAFPIKTDKGFMVCTISRDITKDKEAREALHQSEEKYRTIIENIRDIVYTSSPDDKVTFISPNISIAGYLPEDVLGHDLSEFIHPEDQTRVLGDLERAIKTGESFATSFKLLKKGGSYIYVEEMGKPVVKDGRVVQITGCIRDITERKLDEERLSLSETRYKMLFENSPVGIISIDTKGNILEANQILLELLGSTSLEATFDINVLTYQPLAKAGFSEQFARCTQSGQVLTFENLYTSKGGKCSYLKLKLTPVRDCLGRIWGAQATVEDISEHKRAEKALFENLQFLQRLIDTIPNPVYYQNLSSVLLGCNKAFEKMFSLTKEVIIGRSIYDLKLADDLEGMCPKADPFCDPCVQIFESSSVMADGQTHHFINYKATYTNSSGNMAGTVGTILDITDRKRIEDERANLINELESRNAEMERFVYTVSHDLRSPLVTISGFVGLLKADLEKESHERAFTDLKMIDNATSRMDRLLRDTLELSRIGRVANPEEAISMDEIIEEALSQTSGKISARGARVYKDEGLPCVYVDRMRFVEAMVNLIENSLKYMGDQTCPEIHIGSNIRGSETVFFIRDNGIGIEQSQHEKIFELFYKVDRNSEGTGTGLAIVKRIIEVHGGRIWIESEKGKGCTVCFTLPVVNAPCTLNN